jgi:hypothetical protein
MELVRTIPKLGVLPELLVFHCPSCKEVDTMDLMSARHETALVLLREGFDEEFPRFR